MGLDLAPNARQVVLTSLTSIERNKSSEDSLKAAANAQSHIWQAEVTAKSPDQLLCPLTPCHFSPRTSSCFPPFPSRLLSPSRPDPPPDICQSYFEQKFTLKITPMIRAQTEIVGLRAGADYRPRPHWPPSAPSSSVCRPST